MSATQELAMERRHRMARTVIYDDRTGAPTSRGSDGVASKIVKYVPVEMITLATLFFAAFPLTGRAVWFWVAGGAALNVGYLMSVSRAALDTPNPRPQFYLLSAVAFVLWSMATIDPVAAAAHLTGGSGSGQRAFVLTFATFSLPILDTLVSRRTPVWQDAAAGPVDAE